MGKHIHKKFDNGFVKFILSKYSNKEFNLDYSLEILKIKKTQFYDLLKKLKNNPDGFDIKYKHLCNNKISKKNRVKNR